MNRVALVLTTLVLSNVVITPVFAETGSTPNPSYESVLPDYTFGAPLPDGPGLSEFDGITSTYDLLARLVYAEAMAEFSV